MRWFFPLFMAFGTIYLAFVAVPAEWLWFRPSAPIFENHGSGEFEGVNVDYARAVLHEELISFSGIVRRVGDDEPVFIFRQGPFVYLPTLCTDGRCPMVAVEDKTLAWWTGCVGETCPMLPIGEYYVSTTWKIERPLYPLLPEWASFLGQMFPPKYVTRVSPPFEISHFRP